MSGESYLERPEVEKAIQSWTDKDITFKSNIVCNSSGVGAYYSDTANQIENVDSLTDSISFTNNRYLTKENCEDANEAGTSANSEMKFYWKGETLNYTQWQALGQD